MKPKSLLPYHKVIIIALILAFLDVITKRIILSALKLNTPVQVFSFLDFRLVYNNGAGFSLFQGFNSVIIVLTILFILFFCYYRAEIPDNKLSIFSVSCLIGGALGNLYDRLMFGFVIDFIDFKFWPVFNFADICLTVGFCCVLFIAVSKRG